jgi:hypothetical protein
MEDRMSDDETIAHYLDQMLAEAELARGDLDTSPPSYASTARRPTRRPRSPASGSATRGRSRASMRACARRSARSCRGRGRGARVVIAWVGVLAALALRQRWARPLALGFAATTLCS